MSDERRLRAVELITSCWCYPDTSHKQMDSVLALHAVDAMLAFSDEESAKVRKVAIADCIALLYNKGAVRGAEILERGVP